MSSSNSLNELDENKLMQDQLGEDHFHIFTMDFTKDKN
jgi:hypothetical protein